MLRDQLDGVGPALLELAIMWLHLGNESLIEQRHNVVATLVAGLEIKETDIPEAQGVPCTEFVTI